MGDGGDDGCVAVIPQALECLGHEVIGLHQAESPLDGGRTTAVGSGPVVTVADPSGQTFVGALQNLVDGSHRDVSLLGTETNQQQSVSIGIGPALALLNTSFALIATTLTTFAR